MRTQRANGRPGTVAIPTGWATGLAPAAAGTAASATITIRHPGAVQAWSDEDDQMVETTIDPHYTGPARIQIGGTQPRSVTAADAPVTTSGYLITVADCDTVTERDIVTVTACDDNTLVGRNLIVGQVAHGSLLVERDLFCTLTS